MTTTKTGKAAATVTDETKFGSDEWGKWAEGVQKRQDDLERRLTSLEQAKAAPAVAVSKGKGTSGGTNVEARLAKLEIVAGLHGAGEQKSEDATSEPGETGDPTKQKTGDEAE